MTRFLDIIIPEYDCDENLMDRLLKSIIRQKNINLSEIGVIIVNDCSPNKFKNSFFKRYPQLNIEYYKKETNDGVGMTRQYGLERSTAKYVTFFDQDDEVYGDDALSLVFQNLKKYSYKCLITGYVEEHSDYNYEHLEFDEKETLHGVFIDRNSMIINGIKFVDGVRFHDDYYMRRILMIALNAYHLKIMTYIWHNNEQSIVRKDRKYSYMVDTYEDWFKACLVAFDYIDRVKAGQSKYFICSIFNLFIVLESQFFKYDELQIIKKSHEKKLYELICKYMCYFKANDKIIKKLYDDCYIAQSKNFGEEMLLDESFDNFCQRMAFLYPEIEVNTQKLGILLDIIVPYYNEKYQLISKLLSSIQRQKNVNFEELQISLVSDNPNNVIDDNLFVQDYPELNIVHYKKNTNDGPGLARQYALDRSEAQYVAFYDADDLMYENDALYKVFYCLKNSKYEILYTNFIVDYNDKITESSYKDLISLHGSFYNRELLLKYNMTFHKKIFLFEDMYFCSITNACLVTSFLEYPTYIWIRRENSLSRIENKDINSGLKEHINDFIESNVSIIDFCISHIDMMRRKYELSNENSTYRIAEFFISKLFYMFIMIESDIFYYTDVTVFEERIFSTYLKIKPYYEQLSEKELKQIFDAQIKVVVNDTHAKEIKKDFESFIKERI